MSRNKIRGQQLDLFDYFETTQRAAETVVVKNYARTLIDLKGTLAGFFEKYEEDGRLVYENMTQYNRLNKLKQEVRGVTVSLYQTNTRQLAGNLDATYKAAFNGTAQMAERAWGSNSLIGIIRQDEINRAINNDISGLKWAERMGIRREQAVLKINETIVQGLHNGETYRQMAARLNEAVGKDVPNAIRIVRTETYRVFHEARKDRLDRIQGIEMTKEWITAKDEAVRSNHKPMHGIKVPYHEDFILPNKNQGFGPGMIGDPKDDINCRCFYVVDEASGDVFLVA